MKITASNGNEVAIPQDIVFQIPTLLDVINKGYACSSEQAARGDREIKTAEQRNSEIRQLPSLLRKMSIMNFKGQVYSGNPYTIYTDDFVECVAQVLGTLRTILDMANASKDSRGYHVDLAEYQIQDAVKWAKSVAKNVRGTL